jgi:hypothetical protein
MSFDRTLMTTLVLAAALPHVAKADEGAISFWLPGLYGNFAATPAQLGWAVARSRLGQLKLRRRVVTAVPSEPPCWESEARRN